MVTMAIAEDNPAEMELLKKAVRGNKDWKLQLTAVDGKNLLQQLGATQTKDLPKILLLDIKMPLLDGLMVTTYCKFKYPTISIIGVSSHTNERLISEVLTEGAIGFISKYFLYPDAIVVQAMPNKTGVLNEAVAATLAGKRYIDPLIVNHPNLIKLSIATHQIIAANYPKLKPKLIEFATLNATGSLTYKEIAAIMCVSIDSVKLYCEQLSGILGVDNRHAVANYCMQHGITKLAIYFDATINNLPWV